MADDSGFAADLTAAMGDTSSASAPSEASVAPVSDDAQPEGATTAPALTPTDPTTPAPTPERRGPIPFDAHKTALDNARAKAVEEYRQKYGWAEQVDPQELQRAITIAQRLRADAGPEAFVSGLQAVIAEAQQRPEIAAAVRSFQGRALAQLRQQQAQSAPAPDLSPLQVQLEDGKTLGLYQAEQVKALIEQAVTAVKQELAPVVTTHAQLQQDRAALAREQAVTQFVETTFADVQTWPGMQDAANRKAVAEHLAQMRIDPGDHREVSLALNAAYRAVILPKMQTSERAKVLDDIHRQAAAGTVNPARTTTAPPKGWDEMSTADALRYAMAQQDAR